MADLTAPPEPRPFLSRLFTHRGRSNRANYWLTLLAIAVPYLAVVFVVVMLFSQPDNPGADNLPNIHPIGIAILVVNWLAACVVSALASIRRLHDRDRSGHWLWLFALVPGLLNVVGALLDGGGDISVPGGIILALGAVIALWALVELGFLRGTPGPNRFGPDPLARNGS
jgi:uncharacterized membrane protein YhaH (DUF805 family)